MVQRRSAAMRQVVGAYAASYWVDPEGACYPDPCMPGASSPTDWFSALQSLDLVLRSGSTQTICSQARTNRVVTPTKRRRQCAAVILMGKAPYE